MIDLYTWATPNGRKASIMLEECALEYRVHPVDIGRREQFDPSFLKISPNAKIPAIVDRTWRGKIAVFESAAILIYLAEKTGKFLPRRGRQRARVLQWCMWQVGAVGPMFGQYDHFAFHAPDKIPYAIERYAREAGRLLLVLERQLAHREYVAGDYSIADILLYPWVSTRLERLQEANEALADLASIPRWIRHVGARPAVRRGMSVPALSGAHRTLAIEASSIFDSA